MKNAGDEEKTNNIMNMFGKHKSAGFELRKKMYDEHLDQTDQNQKMQLKYINLKKG